MPDHAAATCADHPECVAITCTDGDAVLWVSHASDQMHVACRIAPGSTATFDGETVTGRDGMCEQCEKLPGP